MNCKTQKPAFRMIECSISNLGKVVTGKTPSTKNSLFWEGDIPFITPKDIQKTKHIFDTERNLTFEGMKSVKNCVLPENAICVSCIGNIGYVAKTTNPAVTNQQINSIIVNDANNSDYVYYLMRSLWQRFKNYEGQSTTLSILNKRQFSEIKILIHEDKAVQTKIANVLSSLDNKIELNEKINQNLEAQAQAIFKSWFVDFEPFGGKMPADWKAYKLGEFLPVTTGKKNANVSSSKGKYPFFSCAQDMAWTDEFSFDANAILVAGNGDFNVKFYSGKFEAYQRTYVLVPYDPNFTNWLYYVVKYNLEKITSGARGSVIKFITKGNLEDFSFFAPRNLDKFTPIDFFNSANNKIAENKLEILKLSQLRDTLLPKLMSKEIDVLDVAV